jgi:hypothetical protein
MTPETIIHSLTEFSWRGIVVPCSAAPYDVSYDLAPRKYYGIDGEAHDNTGRNSYTFSATLLFLNTLEPDLFPERYEQFYDATTTDKSPGLLNHPVLGLVRARFQSMRLVLDAKATAGVVVEANWIETVEDIDERVAYAGPGVSVEDVAAQADAALAALNIPYPMVTTPIVRTGDTAPTRPTFVESTSLSEAYAAIKGGLFSASLTATGVLNQYLGIVSRIVDDVVNLDDHNAWAARTNLYRLYASVMNIRRNAERLVARATATKTYPRRVTLDEVARDVGNKLSDVMGLNVELLRAPYCEVGVPIRYYTGEVRLAA